MILSPENFPTPLSKALSRLMIIGPDQSADTFLAASYVFECSLKLVATVLHAGLNSTVPAHAYKVGYDLLRADGLGTWPANIEAMTAMPLSSFLPPEFQQVNEWFSRKRTRAEDEWCREAIADIRAVLEDLGVDFGQNRRETVRLLVASLVQIRNKTKAHGALGPDFFARNNTHYLGAVSLLVENCPAFRWRWLHLSHRAGKVNRGVLLSSLSPRHLRDAEVNVLQFEQDGIYVQPLDGGRLFYLGQLLKTSLECQSFYLPNGAFNEQSGCAEVIDYSNGDSGHLEFPSYLVKPAPLPPSETEGLNSVEVQSDVFGNLPGIPLDYVRRAALENELSEKLCDQNHEIVTLHGNGGMGKTYLALAVAHDLSARRSDRFESVVWFSARDLDLRIAGPRAVRPQVVGLADVYKKYSSLFGDGGTIEDFARVLQGEGDRKKRGTLFIFDNFETMQDLTELHRFLDQHTTCPNKVLLTSRERAFKADYPIEVKGMEKEEARKMVLSLASDFRIESLLTDDVFESIYGHTKGHPYVMKVIVGEMAKEKRFISPVQVLSARLDVPQAVFERSFSKLSDGARTIFLVLSNWKSLVSELSLLVVLGIRGVDVEAGLEECLRLSLIQAEDHPEGQRLYSVPELARSFGKRKLDGDPDRLVIQADIEMLRRFGVTSNARKEGAQGELVARFLTWCREEARQGTTDKLLQIDALMETLAAFWPGAWLELARFRRQRGATSESIDSALRRAVEENPADTTAWLERADHARATGNEATKISALVSAVDSKPDDVELVRDVAAQLTRYVKEQEIPQARRYVFISSVRSHMETLVPQLDATGLSRLAWLYILENDTVNGKKYAAMGLTKEPGNSYCARIIEQLTLSEVVGRP